MAVIAPLAFQAVQKIDAIFDIEREINGHSAVERLTVRRAQVAPLVADLHTWMLTRRLKVSGSSDLGKAFDYMLRRWDLLRNLFRMGESV